MQYLSSVVLVLAETSLSCCGMSQVAEEQAALDALSELGMQQDGAEAILAHPSQVIQDVTSKALGRAPSPDVTLAAVHALATIAGSLCIQLLLCRCLAVVSLTSN